MKHGRDSDGAESGSKPELSFDLDTAIRVCRQAGYFEHAAYLAKKYARHDDYLRIQIDDAENFEDALGYLKELATDVVSNSFDYFIPTSNPVISRHRRIWCDTGVFC